MWAPRSLFYHAARWKGRPGPFLRVVGISPPIAMNAFNKQLEQRVPGGVDCRVDVSFGVLTDYGLSKLVPDEGVRGRVVEALDADGWAVLPVEDLVSPSENVSPLVLPDGASGALCSECSPTYAIISHGIGDWLCTRFFYVLWHRMSPIDELVLYVGLSYDQAVAVLCGHPSKEEVESWMAMVSLSR